MIGYTPFANDAVIITRYEYLYGSITDQRKEIGVRVREFVLIIFAKPIKVK